MDRIDTLLDRVTAVCPLPKTAERLLELTSSERSSIAEVARLIATDPALAAAVFRIANSALYGSARVDRLETAVIRIGLRELHDLGAAMSLMVAFRNRGEILVTLHDQSVVVGAVAHRLAKTLGGAQANVAFTAGLLSEIGAMACLSVDGKDYGLLWMNTRDNLAERVRLERERYGGTSHVIGGRFLLRHGLPETLCSAVATEHDAEFGNITPMARYVVLARWSVGILLGPLVNGETAVALQQLEGLPQALLLPELTPERLLELCVQAGVTAERELRTGR